MMVSAMLAMMLAASAGQASDTTRASREAFTSCLRAYVDSSLEAGMSADEFGAAYPRQCAAQETAFRQAIISRETAARISRADAEEAANLEIEDARLNFSERFDMSTPPAEPQSEPVQQAQVEPQAETPEAQAPDPQPQ